MVKFFLQHPIVAVRW